MTSTDGPRRRALDNVGFSRRCAGRQETLLFELPRDRNDLLLSRFDLAEPHSAKHFHLLAQHGPCTLGRGGEEPVTDSLARTLEGNRQRLAVGPLHELAERAVLDVDQVIEDEHQFPNCNCEVRRLALHRVEHGLADGPLEPIE